MTHPLTPREKVVFKQPCEHCQRMTAVDITALASGSGDHAELARLAEAATEGPWEWWSSCSHWRLTGADRRDGGVISATKASDGFPIVVCNEDDRAFIAAANPDTILALLADIAALRAEVSQANANGASHWSRATEAERKLAEAVAILREWMGTWFVDADSRGESAIADDTRKFLSKEAERG